MSEIRYSTLYDTHVIIAPERLHRPSCNIQTRERRASERVCPFCEGNEKLTPPEIFALRLDKSFANERGWSTRVVPNLYKALQIEAPHKHHTGEFPYWEGFGAHEIIIDTPKHHTSITEWSERELVNWLTTVAQRVNDLRRDMRLLSLNIFKNEGVEAGGTQPHSHTQIIGLPFIPKTIKTEYERVDAYYTKNAESLMGSMLKSELKAEQSRIIATNGDFTAFCPFASIYPFEIMISSQNALGEIDRLSTKSMQEIAPLLIDVLKRLQTQLNCLDFNLVLSTPPLQEKGRNTKASRFYIRILPRIYKYGGFEQMTNMMINPVAPELAAKLLRESIYE